MKRIYKEGGWGVGGGVEGVEAKCVSSFPPNIMTLKHLI
jgi:hypothetical protein